LEFVLSTPNLSPRERQDRASALRTLSRLSGKPLEASPCQVRSVRKLFASVTPARHGLSQGRWANVKSLVFRSLEAAGATRSRQSGSASIHPVWRTLLEPLPYLPYHLGLIPFARFCTDCGLAPDAVGQATFDAFGEHLEQHSSRARPRDALLNAIRAWNKAGRQKVPWPPFQPVLMSKRQDYSLPWDAFPATFRQDVEAMTAAAISPDPFAADSAKPVKAVTARARQRMLRTLASAFVHSGGAAHEILNVRSILDLARARQALTWIYKRIGSRKTTHLRNFANTISVAGQAWASVEAEHLDALRKLRRHLDPEPGGM